MQKHFYSTTVITKETSPATVVSLSLEEQLSLQDAMQPACRSLVSLVRLGYYFRYHTGSFLALWNEYWGASAEFELEVLRVHLREVPFLKQTLDQHRPNIYKYMEQLTLLSKMVQSDAAGDIRLGWGGDMYYGILRNHYPDEWCWLLHAYAHPDAEEREVELMLRRGKH